ncbi:hypothetical protein POF51_22485 [Brevibacillus sp. AG]|uniref:hypothetical protein n=1 Tax=Brevibacillus sp. AG TaxID=3020891 RepID=UPI0023301588|nr:hypothetical protein [Brevibacillus sp. AG]MDC0763497.1 hypothetical protein [Brevibacillus sp. AG]
MAKQSLLGKDLVITFTTNRGGVLKLELDKFDPEPKTTTIEKQPLGESSKTKRTVWEGWEISLGGEVVDPTVDLIFHELEKSWNGESFDDGLVISDVRTAETYSDGTVQKWRYHSENSPVQMSDFKLSGGDGKDPRKFEFKIFAKRRAEVK